ncbi:hypothetical protein LCGC14_0412300 [marine sediment metagenome]|uniref:Uncharacterized protein n=1 Tax=marine sediment metagenome TaxID=412755 RepID=A0A0F9SZA8_9ZZZZ
MKRKVFVIAVLAGLLSWSAVNAQYPTWPVREVFPSSTEEDTLKTGGVSGLKDSTQILFPAEYSKPLLEGSIALVMKINAAVANSDSDSLNVWIREVQLIDGSYVISQQDSILLTRYGSSQVDYDSSWTYSWPITDDFGPCHGVEVYIDNADTDAGTDTTHGIPHLVIQ